MKTRPEVTLELRKLFENGATPSRLVRHVEERHQGEPHLRFLIQDYFREAFGVDFVRGISLADRRDQLDVPYGFLNEELVHEMIERRAVWESQQPPANGKPPWFNTLSATSDEARMQEAGSISLPELANCWDKLTPEERRYIQRLVANTNGLYETVKVLAALAEALQQRVCEVESQVVGRTPQ